MAITPCAAQQQDMSNKVKVSGGLGGQFSYYDVDGINNRRPPLGYLLTGNVHFRWRDIAVPLNFVFNEQGTSFSQPFRQFGISPKYKWIRAHAGYRNMRFSEFTLNGVTFLGGGVELRPGKFRFSAMYGRLSKAIYNPQDVYQLPKFERRGYGASIGWGSSVKFFDLHFFQALDRDGSIQVPDSAQLATAPSSNTTIGSTFRLPLVKEKLYFMADGAVALNTRNQNAQEIDSEDARRFNGLLSFFDLNTSSNVAGAGSAQLQYTAQTYGLGLVYRVVQGGFQSHGVNYLINDLEQITANGTLNLMGGNIRLHGSYGIQRNNLDDRRWANTGRRIGSLSANARVNDRLNFSLSYANFSIYQTIIGDTLFLDSLLVSQVSHNVTLSGIYNIPSGTSHQTITVVVGRQDFIDQSVGFGGDLGNKLDHQTVNYSVRLNETRWRYLFGFNRNKFSAATADLTRWGFTTGLSKDLANKKATAGMNVSWNNANDNRLQTTYNLWNLTLRASWNLTAKQHVSLLASVVERGSSVPFTEYRGTIAYRMRF